MAEKVSAAEQRIRDRAMEEARETRTQEANERAYERSRTTPYAKGGKVGSASKRADGIATKGKTRGTMIAMCGGGMAKRK